MSDTHPHFICRRYAEFASSILCLNEAHADHLLDTGLARLRTEVEQFIGRATFDTAKKRLIFLINNYDLIANTMDINQQEAV